MVAVDCDVGRSTRGGVSMRRAARPPGARPRHYAPRQHASGWFVAATARLGQQKELAPQEDEATNAWLRKATAALARPARRRRRRRRRDRRSYPGPWPKSKHRAEWYGGGLWEQVGWARIRGARACSANWRRHGLAGTPDGRRLATARDAADCADFVARIVEVWSRVPAAPPAPCTPSSPTSSRSGMAHRLRPPPQARNHARPRCGGCSPPSRERELGGGGRGRPVRLRPQSIFV